MVSGETKYSSDTVVQSGQVYEHLNWCQIGVREHHFHQPSYTQTPTPSPNPVGREHEKTEPLSMMVFVGETTA